MGLSNASVNVYDCCFARSCLRSALLSNMKSWNGNNLCALRASILQTTQTNLLWAVRDTTNKEAWISFYRIYAPMLGHFAQRLGLSDADCEDVTQDVLMAAHRSLVSGVYDPARGRFRRWLYGIARKRVMQAMRERHRRTRVQHAALASGLDPLQQLADPQGEAAAAHLWEQEWRYALLDEALRQVSGTMGEKVFQAFNLFALERHQAEQVAEQLGIAVSSVYVYKQRVLKAVREWIEQFEQD